MSNTPTTTTANIYLVRHGQSTGNRDNKIQGHADAPLTDIGRDQAQALSSYISNNQQKYQVQRVYASDLERAYNTGQAIANQLNIEIIQKPELREAYFGKWEGKSAEDIHAGYPDEYNKWRKERLWRPEWCESSDDMVSRGQRVIQQSLKETQGNIVIASHGGLIYSLLSAWKAENLDKIQNCSMSIVECLVNSETWEVYDYDVQQCNYLPEGVQSTPIPGIHMR